jgi:bidirectional [NiFe] hydrogenase diaphorase subunit
MITDFSKPVPPSQDKRWRLVDTTMRKLGNQSRGLIETLHTVQETFGYLDEAALRYVAVSLRVPLSRAYGVATFYQFFTLKPVGEHTCVVCTGTACYIKGAGQLMAAIKKDLGIGPGETTPDGKVSLVTARCLGSCGLAPAVVYDHEVAGKVTVQALKERLVQWKRHDS